MVVLSAVLNVKDLLKIFSHYPLSHVIIMFLKLSELYISPCMGRKL